MAALNNAENRVRAQRSRTWGPMDAAAAGYTSHSGSGGSSHRDSWMGMKGDELSRLLERFAENYDLAEDEAATDSQEDDVMSKGSIRVSRNPQMQLKVEGSIQDGIPPKTHYVRHTATIGRIPFNMVSSWKTVTLAWKTISSTFFWKGHFYVRDERSKNGTFVDGRQISAWTPARLSLNSKITLGDPRKTGCVNILCTDLCIPPRFTRQHFTSSALGKGQDTTQVIKVDSAPDGTSLSFALKVSRDEDATVDGVLSLLPEVELMRMCGRHPYLVDFYACFISVPPTHEDLGSFAIAMELCEKGTLADLVKRSKETSMYISKDVVLKLFKQTLSCLTYLHATKHIVHRDIKPQNIFLSEDGNVRIGDFGTARGLLNTLAHATTMDAGTLSYMPPEQLRHQRYDFGADIFSLGQVFYELCTLNNAVALGVELAHPAKHSTVLKRLKDELMVVANVTGYPTHFINDLLLMISPSANDRPKASDLLYRDYLDDIYVELGYDNEYGDAASFSLVECLEIGPSHPSLVTPDYFRNELISQIKMLVSAVEEFERFELVGRSDGKEEKEEEKEKEKEEGPQAKKLKWVEALLFDSSKKDRDRDKEKRKRKNAEETKRKEKEKEEKEKEEKEKDKEVPHTHSQSVVRHFSSIGELFNQVHTTINFWTLRELNPSPSTGPTEPSATTAAAASSATTTDVPPPVTVTSVAPAVNVNANQSDGKGESEEKEKVKDGKRKDEKPKQNTIPPPPPPPAAYKPPKPPMLKVKQMNQEKKDPSPATANATPSTAPSLPIMRYIHDWGYEWLLSIDGTDAREIIEHLRVLRARGPLYRSILRCAQIEMGDGGGLRFVNRISYMYEVLLYRLT